MGGTETYHFHDFLIFGSVGTLIYVSEYTKLLQRIWEFPKDISNIVFGGNDLGNRFCWNCWKARGTNIEKNLLNGPEQSSISIGLNKNGK